MRDVRPLALSALVVAASLLLALTASAQSSAPDVPVNPGPACVSPAPPAEPEAVAPLASVSFPWAALAGTLARSPAFPFLSVVRPGLPTPAVLREPQRWSGKVVAAAAGRFVAR